MNRSFGLEFDEFEEAMRGVDGRYTPVRLHKHEWKMRLLVLRDLEVMLCQNGGGSVYEGACQIEKFGVFFPLSPIDSLIVNGCDVEASTLTWLASGKDFHIYNSDVLPWVGISIGNNTIRRWLGLEAEHFPLHTDEHFIGAASRAHLASLRDLVIRLFDAQDQSPDALSSPYVGAECYEQLAWSIYDAVRSVGGPRTGMVGRPRLARDEIIRRATALLEMRIAEPVHVADLCRAARVSHRTLQTAFVEYFGVGPHRYLMLKRLRDIHQALQHARPSESIAQICGRFGVWDFGRFAGLYRRVYGVSPARTLARRTKGSGHARSLCSLSKEA
jgi:AraC family ethanolamine operon transcriptional activator